MRSEITYSPLKLWLWRLSALINKGYSKTIIDKNRKAARLCIKNKTKYYLSPQSRQRTMMLANIHEPISLYERFNHFLDRIDTWFCQKQKQRNLKRGIYDTEKERVMANINSIRRGSLASRINEFDRPSILVNKPIFGITYNPYYKELS